MTRCLHIALLALAAAFAPASQAQAKADQVQYMFSGQCNGLLHWVSLLYDRPSNKVSTVILRAKCPHHETQTFRIFREVEIPVNLGGRFSEIIKQSGIDYYIDGNIHSPRSATLRHKGPKSVLTCGTPNTDFVGPILKTPICNRFNLKVRTAE